jgi:hypothetical protein
MSWEAVYKFSLSWVDVMIFTSIYLESFVWPDAISRYDNGTASNFMQNSEKWDEDPGND